MSRTKLWSPDLIAIFQGQQTESMRRILTWCTDLGQADKDDVDFYHNLSPEERLNLMVQILNDFGGIGVNDELRELLKLLGLYR